VPAEQKTVQPAPPRSPKTATPKRPRPAMCPLPRAHGDQNRADLERGDRTRPGASRLPERSVRFHAARPPPEARSWRLAVSRPVRRERAPRAAPDIAQKLTAAWRVPPQGDLPRGGIVPAPKHDLVVLETWMDNGVEEWRAGPTSIPPVRQENISNVPQDTLRCVSRTEPPAGARDMATSLPLFALVRQDCGSPMTVTTKLVWAAVCQIVLVGTVLPARSPDE
jgi:hypothetical protein